MNRPSLAFVGLVPILGLLAAACSAAPGSEATSQSAQADTSYLDIPCSTPFDEAKSGLGMVCTQTDPEDGTRKRVCTKGVITTCHTGVAAPVAPTTAYPTGTSSSCDGATPVAPPPELAECTVGYAISENPFLTISAYLCPIAVVNEAAAGTLQLSGWCGTASIGVLSSQNGCFGAPLDPTNWGYVQVLTDGLPAAPSGACGNPTPCGQSCIDVFPNPFGPTTPPMSLGYGSAFP